jgi:homoserine dehydrogenase
LEWNVKNVRLALIGFGHVNQGLVELLLEDAPRIEKNYGVRYTIVGVCTATKGSLYDPSGLDLDQLLKAGGARQHLQAIPAPPAFSN